MVNTCIEQRKTDLYELKGISINCTETKKYKFPFLATSFFGY